MSQLDFIKYTRTPEFITILKNYEEALNSGVNRFIEAEDLIDISEYFHMNKMLEKAEEAADYCLEIYPGNVSALFFKARMALTDQNDADKAEATLKLIKNYRDYTEGVYIAAEILICKGRPEEADRILQEKYEMIGRAASEDSSDKGNCYDYDDEEEDEYDEEDTVSAYIHFPLDTAMIFCDYGYTTCAEKWLKRLGTPPEDLLFEFWETWGRIHLDRGRLTEAQTAWNKALDLDAYNVNAWLQLCDAQLRSGQTEEALQSTEFALAIEPKAADAQISKGCCLFDLKRYDEAIQTFEWYENIYPEDTQPNLYLATIYFEQKETEKGVKQFKNAIEKSDYDPNIAIKIGSILYEMNYRAAAYSMLKSVFTSYEETGKTDDCPEQLLDYLIKCCNDLQKTDESEKYTKIKNSRNIL